MMGWSPRCYIPSFVEIGPLVPEECYEMDKTSIFMFEILDPGGQLWANTAFEGSQFYSIGVPKFYSWVNVISVYAYNDLG